MKDTFGGIAVVVIYLLVVAGYVMNIVQLFQHHYSEGMLIAKVVGILVFPLGILMGVIG